MNQNNNNPSTTISIPTLLSYRDHPQVVNSPPPPELERSLRRSFSDKESDQKK